MEAARARVEWEKPPEDWMLPAAAIFDVAMRDCIPPVCDSSTGVVVHISVFSESARPHGCTGEVLPSSAQVVVLVSEPMVYLVPPKYVLSTEFGTWLIQHSCLNKLVLLLVCALALLASFDPWQEKEQIHDSETGLPVDIIKHSIATLVSKLVLMSGIIYLAAHAANKKLIKVSSSYFDVIMIIGFRATVEFTLRWEFFPCVSKSQQTHFVGLGAANHVLNCSSCN